MLSNSPLVSIIVPTKNSGATLEVCLDSIKKQTHSRMEIIVVDNNSQDHTKEIANKYTHQVFNRGPERSAQRNYGAGVSNGEYLLFIDSDMELSLNVVEECVKLARDKNFVSIIIPEESFGCGFWARCKKLERSFYLGVDWMEAARFFERTVFEEMRGYDEKNTGTEDYDLPSRIEYRYGSQSMGRVNSFIYHNEQKISLIRTCKKKYYYAQNLDQYKSVESNRDKFKKQSNILERYKLFFRQPIKLFSNPLVGLGMIFMKTCEFGVGYLGLLKTKK